MPLITILENTEVHLLEVTLFQKHLFRGTSRDDKVIENENKGLLEIQCSFSIKSCNISQCEIFEIFEDNDRQFCHKISSWGPTMRKSHKFYAQVQGEMAIK